MRDFDPTASEFITSGYLERSRPGGLLFDPASLLGAGASIFGGLMGSDSAGDAANAQSQAAAASDATQRYQYDTTRADNAPFLQTGVAANNKLAQLMGLSAGGSKTSEQLRSELIGSFTSPGAASQGAWGVIGNPEADWPTMGYTGGTGTPTIDEAGLNSAIQARLAQQAQEQATAQSDPSFGSLSRNFSTSDLNADPVYQSGLQFGLDQGTQAINRQAAASGSMLSGATLKALTRFGNDYGSTKANESYNRFNTNNNQQYNRLAGLSGAGQQATNQVGAAGMNMANNISQTQQGVGNANASSYIAQGNALQNGINGAVSSFKNNSLFGANPFSAQTPWAANTTIPMQPGGGY